MTDAATMPTRADAQFVHDEWDRRTRAHNIEGLLELYLPDATLESPLVPRILDQTSGVLHGHDELRTFFVRGTQGRPNDLVRWYRTGEFMFDKRTLYLGVPPAGPRVGTGRPGRSHGTGWTAHRSPPHLPGLVRHTPSPAAPLSDGLSGQPIAHDRDRAGTTAGAVRLRAAAPSPTRTA